MTHEPMQEIFRRAAERWGGHLAVDSADEQVTYRQLAERAGRAAAALHDGGAEPGSLVAILAGRTADVIAGMLGALEAGCAFVPLDPGFPVATLPALLAEVQPRWWLAGAEHVDALAELRQIGRASCRERVCT